MTGMWAVWPCDHCSVQEPEANGYVQSQVLELKAGGEVRQETGAPVLIQKPKSHSLVRARAVSHQGDRIQGMEQVAGNRAGSKSGTGDKAGVRVCSSKPGSNLLHRQLPVSLSSLNSILMSSSHQVPLGCNFSGQLPILQSVVELLGGSVDPAVA